jgi:alpha-galactosidase
MNPIWSFGRKSAAAFLSLIAFVPCAYCQSRSWTLDNGHVSRKLSYDEDTGLRTLSWRNVETGTDFIDSRDSKRSECKEFRVRIDGVQVTGSAKDVRLDGYPSVQQLNSNLHLDIALVAKQVPVRVVVHYEAAAGFAGIRQWLTFENLGTKTVTLRNLAVECQDVQPGPAHDLIAFGHYGEEPRETFYTGRVNDVAVLLENARTEEGLAILSEVPGYLRRTEIGGWGPRIQAMYDTDLFPFERRLEPGEKFDTAAASVVFYRRGTASDPHWVLPEYAEQIIARNKNDQPPNWIYNNWEPWNSKATSTILEGVIPRAAEMGLTLNTIDEGWEKTLGDNTPNPERFPNGIEPMFRPKETPALKRGLWLPVALVSKASSSYRDHPEWVCRGRDGMPKESQGQGVVMCLASPYKRLALDRIRQAVRQYDLDYVKLDLTTVFNTYGEEPGCYESGHEHASAAESTVRIYEALDWLGNRLHEEFPRLLIDYTFELWGEKHLIDYRLLRVADLDWLSNVSDGSLDSAGPLQVRTLLYQRGMAIPTEDMLIGNMQAEMPTWQERVATAMASAPVFLGDLHNLSRDDAEQASKWIHRFQELRRQVPLNESFFPLGYWQQPRVTSWDGFGRFSKSGEGLIVIFRNESGVVAPGIAIPGFPPGRFRMTDWSSGIQREVEGSELVHGLSLKFGDKRPVVVLEIRRQ